MVGEQNYGPWRDHIELALKLGRWEVTDEEISKADELLAVESAK